MDWYKKDIVAYRRHTRRLKPLENGIYERLLDEYYATEGPLPNDVQHLKNVCRCTQKWESAALSKVLDEFFPLNGDGTRHNKRADEEIADYKARCEANRATARQRIAQRLANESPTSRPPIHTDIHTNRKAVDNSTCQHVNPDGTKCGLPGRHTLHPRSDKWFCNKHQEG